MRNINTKGYTLLETIAYIAIFIIVMVAVLDMLLTLSKSFSRVRAYNEVRVDGMSVVERIAREVRTAGSVNILGSDFDAHPGNLLINTTDAAGTAKTIEFYWNSTAKNMNIIDNGVDKGALNGSSTEITSIVFRNASTTKGEAIKIELTLQSKRTTAIAAKFYDTIVMRGGY
ncbi:MAG: type II secretion system protein [Parcubacteria group bacterium]|nr:type II secretion system protein [Parcubacteria group bacterium]